MKFIVGRLLEQIEFSCGRLVRPLANVKMIDERRWRTARAADRLGAVSCFLRSGATTVRRFRFNERV